MSGYQSGCIFWRSWVQISAQRPIISVKFVIFSPSRQMLGWYLDLGYNHSLVSPLVTNHPNIWHNISRETEKIVKWAMNISEHHKKALLHTLMNHLLSRLEDFSVMIIWLWQQIMPLYDTYFQNWHKELTFRWEITRFSIHKELKARL